METLTNTDAIAINQDPLASIRDELSSLPNTRASQHQCTLLDMLTYRAHVHCAAVDDVIGVPGEQMAVPRLLAKDASQAHGGVHVWSRQMHNGDVAVAMVNMEPASGEGTLAISDLVCTGCSRTGTAFNVWTGKRGKYSDQITLTIPSHETVLLRLTPDGGGVAGAAGSDL